MLARDVMSGGVVTVGARATLLEAVKLLVNTHVSGLVVTDDSGGLLGILSEFDIIRHVAGSDAAGMAEFQAQLDGGGDPDIGIPRLLSQPVASIMTTPAISVPDDADLKVVAEHIVERRIRRVPVVREGLVVGVVGRIDLLKAMLSRSTGHSEDRIEAPPPSIPSVSDEQLRRDVEVAIRQTGIAVGGGFDVVARHGVVHLWGEVTDELDHQTCRVAALKVSGVQEVISHMQVLPRRRETGFRRQ